MILDAEEDVEVVAVAADGVEAVRLARALRPDVALLDIQMPNLDGLEAARQLLGEARSATLRVIMLTTFDKNEYVFEALRVGASGFLLKDTPAEQLAAGIRAAVRGESLLAPVITRRLVEEFTRRPLVSSGERPAVLERLTTREQEVFQLLARGMSNQEIAQQLFLGETTVKTHVTRVLTKLDLRDRIQAVVMAYETGVVQPGG
jgi:DNA-binding NarL/FixJ family response regulator